LKNNFTTKDKVHY